MKVLKEPGMHGGFNVIVEIGSRVNKSYFQAPSESVDHAGKEYIQGRFPFLNTKKRIEDFKRLYKNLWIEIDEAKLDLMKHCIGVPYSKKPYRNYFCTNEDDADWNFLVEKGLAVKGESKVNAETNCIYFWLSRQGVEFVLNKPISMEFYKEL